MTTEQAMQIAEQVAEGRCSLTHHQGASHMSHAIRLSGCTLDEASEIGRRIAGALPGGAYRQAEGFAAVWYDVSQDYDAWKEERDAFAEWSRQQ